MTVSYRHRARAIAAKKMLSGSATAISEILGIAPTPDGQLTTLDDDATAENMTKITTSSKSVADYFKEKLLSRTSSSTRINSKSDIDEDGFDAPRGGIGSRSGVDSVV